MQIIMDVHAHRTIIRFSFALLNDVLIFSTGQIFELEKVDRRPGIKTWVPRLHAECHTSMTTDHLASRSSLALT